MRTLSPVEPDINFSEMEPLVYDAHAMVDALNNVVGENFSSRSDDGGHYVLHQSDADRLYFLTELALAMSKKVRDAYYVAWDNARKTATAPKSVEKAAAAKEVPSIEAAQLSMFGLFSLYDALNTVHDVMSGLASQPRFTDGVELPLHGDMLQRIAEYVAALMESIREEATAREVSAESDIKMKLFFLTLYCADGLSAPDCALEEFKAAVAKLGGAS